MAKETVVEYETIEREETRTVCDNCGRTDEDETVATVAINPKVEKSNWGKYELVREVESELEAHEELNRLNKMEAPMGIGKKINRTVEDMRASATADMCASCITKIFDIDVEAEDIDDIDINENEINIESTEKVVRNYPTIELKPIRYSYVLAFPVYLAFSILDIALHPHSDLTGRDGPTLFLSASIGAILWITGIFMIFLVEMGLIL